jgi:hypothetical protein
MGEIDPFSVTVNELSRKELRCLVDPGRLYTPCAMPEAPEVEAVARSLRPYV